MKGLIGFWLISEAIAIMIVIVTGIDLDFIEMVARRLEKGLTWLSQHTHNSIDTNAFAVGASLDIRNGGLRWLNSLNLCQRF